MGLKYPDPWLNLAWNLFIKTQGGGEEQHRAIVGLLKYLSQQYFETFKAVDEGRYWETMDEELLRERFEDYRMLIGAFKNAL